MKRLLTILLVVCFCAPVYGGGTMYLKGTDTFMISHGVPDSAGLAYTAADSVQITVMFQDGTESMAATWFNNADAQAVLSNGKLYFYDVWTDMNGSDSLGAYTVTARWYDGSDAALDYQETYTVIQVTKNLETISTIINNVSSIEEEVTNIDGWNPITDNDSLIIDQSTRIPVGDTIQRNASTFDPTSDSVNVDGSALAATAGAISNTTLDDDVDVNVATITDDGIKAADFAPDALVAAAFADDFWAALADSAWLRSLSSGKRIIDGVGTAGIELRDVDMRIAGYSAIGTIEDSSGNTATMFQTDLADTDNDIYNRSMIVFLTGTGAEGQVTSITDYVGASGVVYINPGLSTGAPNTGDSFAVLMMQSSLIPNDPDSNLVSMGGTYPIISDLNRNGDTLAVMPQHWTAAESTAYQGDAAGLTAKEIIDSLSEAYFDTVYAVADFDSAFWKLIADSSGGGGGGAGIGDSTIARVDSILTSLGFDEGGPTDLKSVQDKLGLEWTASDATVYEQLVDIEDDSTGIPDSLIARVDSMWTFFGGRGENTCKIYVKSGANYPANLTVKMVASGGTSYYQQTDANGLALFQLDDGTYSGYLISSPAYSQDTLPQTFTFTADYNDTLTASATTVGSPGGGANFCSTYIYTYGILGDTIEGATFSMVPKGRGPWIDSNGVAIIPLVKTAATNSNGYVGLAVYRSSVVRQLQPDGTQGGDSLKYDISLTYKNRIWRADDRVVPDSGSWWVK